MQSFDTFLHDGAANALARMEKIPVKTEKDLPNVKKGYYAIYMNNTLIYDGVSTSSVRGRLMAHLFRSRKYDASSAMAIETIPCEVFDKLVEDLVIRVEDTNYFKQTADKTVRYLNGININQYPDDTFHVAVHETNYPDVLKTTSREINGVPTGAQYKVR